MICGRVLGTFSLSLRVVQSLVFCNEKKSLVTMRCGSSSLVTLHDEIQHRPLRLAACIVIYQMIYDPL
jgi:hypothetical protein